MGERFSLVSGRVCPACGKKLKRKDSYSQPGDGKQLYHFACWYAKQAEAR